MQVQLTVNGQSRSDEVEPRLLLVHYLRQRCGLRAANVGCDTTSCGACTVLLNGRSVKSCTMLTVQAAGQNVTTASAVSDQLPVWPTDTAPLPQAFVVSMTHRPCKRASCNNTLVRETGPRVGDVHRGGLRVPYCPGSLPFQRY